MKRVPGFVVVIAAAAWIAACGFQRTQNVLSPSPSGNGGSGGGSNPSNPPSGSGSGSYTGTWASQGFTVPSASTCGNFQWNVTSQTTTTLAGTFSATCAGGIAITGEASGQLVNSTTVPITVKGTAVGLPGIATCDFNLSGNGTVLDNATTLSIPYTGMTCLGPVHGTEVLHKKSQPAPTPTPDPTPTPAPPPPAGPSDAIDLNQASVYNSPPDIASWPITGAIRSIQFAQGVGLAFTFDQQNSWPDYTPPGWNGPLEYTVWALVRINGRWDTSGFIQMWRGRPGTGAGITVNNDFSRNWAYDSRWGPMAGYQPVVGEQMGFFLSAGDARGQGTVTSLRQRTNVVAVSLPAGDNGAFSFSLGRLPMFSRH